jgi:hypothetical protein
VKRLSLLISLLLLSGSFSTISFANTQDQSFTFQSTAGMFEDTYDYFKYSPAYLPSFQRNVFWGQFSNLGNSYDQQINNSSLSNPYYLFGGQMDMMGMGRGGVMFDWTGASTSQNNVNNYNHPVGNTGVRGLYEDTLVTYTTSGGAVIDGKTTSYSHVNRVDNQSNNDLYLAYGLGGIMGMDFGAALRGRWWVSNPTYDPWQGTAYGNAGYTFDETTNVRSYNLLTNALTTTFDRNGSGSLSYGNYNWLLDLGGRAKNLFPNLDLVVNLGPILNINSNKLTAESTDKNDWEPNNPGLVFNQTITHRISGMEPGANSSTIGLYSTGDTFYFYPGSGIGVLANARGDYAYNPNIILTGQLGFLTQPITLSSDAKEEFVDTTNLNQTVGGLLLTTNLNNDFQRKYEGNINSGQTYAKFRSQFLSKGWKLGLGINYTNSWYLTNIKDTQTTRNVMQVSGTGSTATDYTETVTSGSETESKYENSNTVVELPIGVVFNILDNLSARLGYSHQLVYSVTNSSLQTTSRTPQVTQRNYNDGTSTTTVGGSSAYDESNKSEYYIYHNNVVSYGASWTPYTNVQIDFTDFIYVLNLNYYRLSISFYF